MFKHFRLKFTSRRSLKSVFATAGISSFVLLSVGCAAVQIQKFGQVDSPIDPGAGVAILPAAHSSLHNEAAHCIGHALSAAIPNIRIITADEFRRSVFHYRPPYGPTQQARYFDLLLKQPALKRQMASLGIHYLITIRGKTEMRGGSGMGGIGGQGAAIVVGAGSWERETNLVASLLDLKQTGRPALDVSATALGHPWFFFILPSPVVLGRPAFTETQACSALAVAVVESLSGKKLEKTSAYED